MYSVSNTWYCRYTGIVGNTDIIGITGIIVNTGIVSIIGNTGLSRERT